jgi:hypothetical protein
VIELPNVWVFRPAIFPIRCRITGRLKALGIPHADDEKFIDALASRAGLYQLAQILALAVRVEPLLLRNARLHFLPASDTELETEFWWSSELIYTRNVQAAVMRSGIARALCNALLTESPERLQDAKKLIADVTRHWPETDRIEQDMRWAVLEDDTVALRQNIQRILKTLSLRREDSAKRELTRWIKGALPALVNPEQAGTEVRWLYQYVSAALGSPGNWLAGMTIAEPLPESLIRALPLVEKQALGLRLHPGVLEILKPDGYLPTIEILLPLPTAVLLSFDGKAKPRWENVWIGRIIKDLPDTNQIVLQTLNGDRFKINIERVQSSESAEVPIPKPATRVVLAYMPDGVEQARMIARYLSEQGIEVDMTDDRESAQTVLSECRLVRLWTKQSAEYWQDRQYEMDEFGKGVLVVTDGSDVSLPHSGVSDTEIIHLSNWETGIDESAAGKLPDALQVGKVRDIGSDKKDDRHCVSASEDGVVEIRDFYELVKPTNEAVEKAQAQPTSPSKEADELLPQKNNNSPMFNYDDENCEFYVDNYHHGQNNELYGIKNWYDFIIHVLTKDGEILNAGMWVSYDGEGLGQVSGREKCRYEHFLSGTKKQDDYWSIRYVYHSHFRRYSASGGFGFINEIKEFAFFVDIKRTNGDIVRLWQSRRGKNYTLDNIHEIFEKKRNCTK